MNVRHAKWTEWPGIPWETWQVHPRQRQYRTYTWFLDLGIDSKAFCFHCWLVIVCFTWGKETILVISLWSPAWTLCSDLSGLYPPLHTHLPQKYHRNKALSPKPRVHLSYDIRLVTWSLLAYFPICKMGLKYLPHRAVVMITWAITCKVYRTVPGT